MQLGDVVTYKNKKKLFVITFIFNVCGVKEYEVTSFNGDEKHLVKADEIEFRDKGNLPCLMTIMENRMNYLGCKQYV